MLKTYGHFLDFVILMFNFIKREAISQVKYNDIFVMKSDFSVTADEGKNRTI